MSVTVNIWVMSLTIAFTLTVFNIFSVAVMESETTILSSIIAIIFSCVAFAGMIRLTKCIAIGAQLYSYIEVIKSINRNETLFYFLLVFVNFLILLHKKLEPKIDFLFGNKNV